MNFEKTLNMVGVAGVIASLLFVGLEIQQSHVIALSTQQQARAHKAIDMIVGFLEAEQDYDAIMRNEELLEDNQFQMARRNFYQGAFYFAENDFNQYQNGLLTDADFEGKVRNVLEYLLGQCDLRPIVDYRSRFFPEEFLKLVESIETPCD
ncbi:MAG: hypothetical protein ACJZ8R_14605 [Pseudohongiellaceae bacterium]|jgi:hypothetical protein|tara:strand:- start:208 stop:660 length:453 start_codon:yes stop_codon:yes gene_type:complete